MQPWTCPQVSAQLQMLPSMADNVRHGGADKIFSRKICARRASCESLHGELLPGLSMFSLMHCWQVLKQSRKEMHPLIVRQEEDA